MVQCVDTWSFGEVKQNFPSEVDVGVEERWCMRTSIVLERGNCSAGRVSCFQRDAPPLWSKLPAHTDCKVLFRVHCVSFLCLGYHLILPGADQEQSITVVRKSLSAPLQVRTQVNPVSSSELCSHCCPMALQGFVSTDQKNLFEVGRALSSVISMVLGLQEVRTGFCSCILVVLSVKLVLCHMSKMNYFSFTLNTLGNWFSPFSSASNLASALFAVLAVIFWGNCHVLLEITQAETNLSFSWIVKYCTIFVTWIGSKTLIEFPCSWSCVWRSGLHSSFLWGGLAGSALSFHKVQ